MRDQGEKVKEEVVLKAAPLSGCPAKSDARGGDVARLRSQVAWNPCRRYPPAFTPVLCWGV